jgi:hypothetical protein
MIIPAIFSNFLGGLAIYVGRSFLYERYGTGIETLEVGRGKEDSLPRIVTEPLHILLNGTNELIILRLGIGIVKTKIAVACGSHLGPLKVDTNRLGVTDMQVAIRLRWEAGLQTATVFLRTQIFVDDIRNKVRSDGVVSD